VGNLCLILIFPQWYSSSRNSVLKSAIIMSFWDFICYVCES